MTDLFVVMPVFNEQDSLEYVVKEWIGEVRRHTNSFTFVVINDGSTDRSLEILHDLQNEYAELKVISTPNSGHGQACLVGYRAAIRDDAAWIFQIDSDGQCLPVHFAEFWRERLHADAVYGARKIRDDSLIRLYISQVFSLLVALATGVRVKDANVPYRLMNGKKVASIIRALPHNAEMVNTFLAVATQKHLDISWIDIRFGKRRGGKKLKWTAMASLMIVFAIQIFRYRKFLASFK